MNRFPGHLFAVVLVVLLTLACLAPAALAQSSVNGQWQTLPYTMPINPIHVALLYNRKVLIVSGSGNVANNTNFQAALWDPQAGTITTQPVTWDMFCNGMVVLPDGRPFVMGGTLQYDPFHGQPLTSTYDPATNTFTNQQSMAHGRWYPTGTVLGDGRVMVFSGADEFGNTNTSVEFYSAGSGWGPAFSAPWTPPLYPRMHLLPNGNVFYSGSTTGSSLFNPATQTWTTNIAFTNYNVTRTYGSSVLLPLTPANSYKPMVMIMGGGDPSTNTTEIIDLSAAKPKWVYGPNMSQPRIEMDATILPNGKVLALGGSLNDEDTSTASLNADLYDPGSNTFSSAGSLVYARLYHSVSLLLPDATVWVAGGNPQRGTYETHMEIYSPPYLFNADGTPATRPTITSTSSSSISYGAALQVQTPDAANISSAVLMRNGADTHAFDMDQRYVGLSFTAGAGVLNVTGPPNGNIAPPGYYMLFILNKAGVPSIATMVQVSVAANDEPPTGTITSPTSNVTISPGQSVSYSGTGSDPDGTISAYYWSFTGGNPSSSNLANPGSVTYPTPGTYVTTFTVTDNAGLTDPNPPTRTVTVQFPPAITSANSTTFTVGTAGSFTVTATGTPTPSLTETGTMPSGVTFKDNGNGTATLSGTPASGTAGTYALTVTASNGVGTAASQGFTLTVSAGGGGSSNFAYVSGSVTGVFNSGAGSSTTISGPLHQSPGAGHLLICAATWQSSTATASMSDPNNGTWTAIGSAKPGVGSLTGFSGQMFYVPSAVNASTTVTLTISSAVVFRVFECAEYSYTGSISSLDGTPQYSTTPASGGVATISGLTTSNSSDLIFSDCLGVDTSCYVGSGYNSLDDANAYNAGTGSFGTSFWADTGQLMEYNVAVAAGAQSATFGTGTSTDNMILGLLGMKASSAQAAPAITSANSSTFTVGTAGSFTVTATGTPTPALTEAGTLPSGVTFKDNGNGTGTLSGTPATGTGGSYGLTFTASNGVGTAANQSFTLKVNQASAITSANSSTFTVGTAGSFTVTATGTPTPALTEAGALPSGVTFKDNGNGTATLSGTPATGTGGSYGLTFTASNGVGTAGNQSFTLTVNTPQAAPAITSAKSSTFTVGTAGSFTVTATGTPTPALTEAGTLPSGVTFKDNGNGTGTLSGTPATGSGGTYSLTFTASNGVGTAANQSFTLTVNTAQTAPAITSAKSSTFTVGTAGSFTVTATGTPTPALTEAGTLPSGVTFKDNGNGTGTLSGTPATGSGGTYSLTFTASNGVGTAANQSFTLTVNTAQTAPAITSANSATFTVGTAGSFTVTATGTPTPSLTETGTLPSGVTFKDNGNGTATLSGTPATGSGGTYSLTFTASNGVGTAANQSFTLTVNTAQTAPAITSANSSTFTVGTAGSFTVTATGTPTPALTEAGTLPSGVTFKDNGNGTGTLSGTPATGSGGTYSLTFTASNGVGTTANQSFTLTVNTPQAPAISSASSTTFTVGTAGSFTVTATGTPRPSLTETGTLPSGVTFKDNGNGTATLSGTPASGTGGTYSLTFTASNGVGTAANQSFTLKVNQAPAITSANSTTFTVGTAGSFTVTATGTPTPTLTETGTLPSGVTFKDNGNGTATLSGTPASGTGGTYSLTFTASNGVGTAANHSFSLRVKR